MTLNSSGTISLAGSTAGQSIELELGGSGTTTISLNDTNVRTLGGVPSGAISLSNFYGKSNFTPVTRTYTSGSGTETVPTGATTLVIEVWGAGGGGSRGKGSGCTASLGNPGGAGGYSRSSYAVTSGKTLSYTVGAAGAGQGRSGTPAAANGASSTVTSGTLTVTSMTDTGGKGSTNAAQGADGTGTGGNVTNASGSIGSAVVGLGGASYGAGGASGFGLTSAGSAGGSGAVKFEYT